MGMSPAYVECDDFRVVEEREIGCLGVQLRYRVYRLRANPDQRPSNDITNSVIATWAADGMPSDAVYHLGSFHRLTAVA